MFQYVVMWREVNTCQISLHKSTNLLHEHITSPCWYSRKTKKYIKQLFGESMGWRIEEMLSFLRIRCASLKIKVVWGVLDMTVHNKCLLKKHLHKFLNKAKLPWVKLIWDTYYTNRSFDNRAIGSFWWKSICKINT